MNEELIDQIAFQAGCDKHWYNDSNNPDLCGRIISREVLDKFAELIVRECITVINQPNGVGDDDVIRISQDVKKHFGVKE